jgi:hypothetical protein
MISDTALRNDLLTNEEPLLFRKWLLLQCATAPADIMAVQCVKQRHDYLSDYIGTKVVKLFGCTCGNGNMRIDPFREWRYASGQYNLKALKGPCCTSGSSHGYCWEGTWFDTANYAFGGPLRQPPGVKWITEDPIVQNGFETPKPETCTPDKMPFFESDKNELNSTYFKISNIIPIQYDISDIKREQYTRAELQTMKVRAKENVRKTRAKYFVQGVAIPAIIKKAEAGETRYTLARFADIPPSDYSECIMNAVSQGCEFICVEDGEWIVKLLKDKFPDSKVEIKEQVRFTDGKTERMLFVDWA